MVVHIGVVVIAVAFAASSSFSESREFRLAPGQSAHLSGHTVTYLGTRTTSHANKTTSQAEVRVDGGKVYAPGLSQFPFATQAIGSPSVKTGPLEDVYLTLAAAPDGPLAPAVIGVRVEPLIAWLWTGGAIMAFGTLLAAWPAGRRRRRRGGPAGPPERVPAEATPGEERPPVEVTVR
jgi:cytochrome c-type biogenesis protein CcmF